MENLLLGYFETGFSHGIFEALSSRERIVNVISAGNKTDILCLTFGNNVRCNIVHQGPVVGNDVIETRDLSSDANDRRRVVVGHKVFYEIFCNAFVNKRVIAKDYAVVIVDIRQRQDALKSDNVERVCRRHGTDSENIDPVTLFVGIVIELLKDTHSKVSVHVADKNTNFHETIILGTFRAEKWDLNISGRFRSRPFPCTAVRRLWPSHSGIRRHRRYTGSNRCSTSDRI